MPNPWQDCLRGALWLVAAVCACAAADVPREQGDLFIAGQDGYHTYRIPAVLSTKSGSLLAFCEGRKSSGSDTGDIDVVLKRSLDNGDTWSGQEVILDAGPNTFGNPCLVLDETTGVVWLLATQNPGSLAESQILKTDATGARTVWVSRSEDDGRSWSTPENITSSTKDPSWAWYATGPGVGVQIRHGPHKGRLVIPCDHSYREPNAEGPGFGVRRGSHVIYSDDHGKTWARGGTVAPAMNECQVVELADDQGTLLLSMRNYLGVKCRAHSISHDGGQSWGPPALDRQLPDPVCQASIVRCNWPSPGKPGALLFSNPASQTRRNMTVRMSRDDGNSWLVARTLNAGPSAYSCLVMLGDGRIGCLYECGVSNAYEKITFDRFPISWLDEEIGVEGK